MITKKVIQYEGFGKCVELCNGIVRVVATLEFGPRIIRYSFAEGENMFFENPDKSFGDGGEDFDRYYGKGAAWYIYGGHRLWTSPEILPRTTYPDNDPVSYELTESGVILTPPIQKWNQIGYVIEITLSENSSDVTVSHRITNHGPWDISLAPWPITVMAPGGTEVIPQPDVVNGCLSNRQLALWAYTKLNDPRVSWQHKFIVLKQDPTVDAPFKFGINSQHGYALYFNHGDVFIKRFDLVENGTYPDGGMSYETYTNKLFLEMESLGELQSIAPGNSITHNEYWALEKGELPPLDDDSLETAVKQYVK